jgi:CRP-like cAMP-binding protein
MGEHLLFVLSGRLQTVDLTEDGREIGLNFLASGDYYGELSIIDGLPGPNSVVATESSLIALMPRLQALSLIYHNPLIAERLLKRMASNIRTASNHRTIIGIPNAFQRVFALLNQFAKVAPGGLVVIDKMPTQQEIAITVNTSRETVSRAIHLLIKRGVVEKDLRRLIVRQPDALRRAVTNAAQVSA